MKSLFFLSAACMACCILLACAFGRREHKVIGTIEKINTDCWVDSLCSMKISGDIIVFGQGWSNATYGELIGFDQDKLSGHEYIGRKVEVFGKKVGDGTSIEGSKKYYIRLLD